MYGSDGLATRKGETLPLLSLRRVAVRGLRLLTEEFSRTLCCLLGTSDNGLGESLLGSKIKESSKLL